MVARNNIHGDTVLTHWFKEALTIMVQRLEVDKLTMIVVITQVYDVFDIVLDEVWKENLRVEILVVF